MKAVICRDGVLEVVDRPTPTPGRGQLLLRVTRAGICGSDLHARKHSDDVAEIARAVGYDDFMRSSQDVVMGHEFVGDVVSYGPGCRKRWSPGTTVVSMPLIRHGKDVHLTGLSVEAPGAYADFVLVGEDVTMPVPDDVPVEIAALTEPLAVAHHAVRRGEVGKKDTAVVIGCGPIGLAVILMLKAAGVRTVVASDLSPARRVLAEKCGASVVVDPARCSPWTTVTEGTSYTTSVPELGGLAFDAMHALQRIPGVPWWSLMRAGERFGAMPSGPVIFECVGVPGIIEDILTHAPLRSRVVVAGVCMQPDTFRPAMAINKEIELRFVFAYDPTEFREALHMLADGTVDPRPLITATVGLAGATAAFDALAAAGEHAKILFDPTSTVTEP